MAGSDEPRKGGGPLPLRARNAFAELLMESLADPRRRSRLEAALALARGEPVVATAEAHARWVLTEADYEPQQEWAPRACGKLAAYVEACDRAPAGRTLRARLAQAEALFAIELYFEVHEVLEPAWLEASGDEKSWLQGLIQAAVAWHHFDTGNVRGAASLAVAASEKLAGAPGAWLGARIRPVTDSAGALSAWLAGGQQGPLPARPVPGGAVG